MDKLSAYNSFFREIIDTINSAKYQAFKSLNKIHIGQNFEIGRIKLQKDTALYKDSIFAICLSNGDNNRFINRNPCLIADTSFLFIYTYKTVGTESKQSGPTCRAKEIPVTYYFFSSELIKEVYSHTVVNLCKCLNLKPAIKDAINQKFNDDEMLYLMNQKTWRFTLNELLIELMKNSE